MDAVEHDFTLPAIGPDWASSAPEHEGMDNLIWPEGAVALLQWDDHQGELDFAGYSWIECDLYLQRDWPYRRERSYPGDAPEASLAKALSLYLSGWAERPIRFERASVVESVGGQPPKRYAVLIAYYADEPHDRE